MLNQKRVDPYDFRLFKMDGVVYLFDNSCLTYPCTPRPHYYCEAIADEETGEYVDHSGYFAASSIDAVEHFKMSLDEEYVRPTVDERTAWDEARYNASQWMEWIQ